MLNYPTTYDRLAESLKASLSDLAELSGDAIISSGVTWTDVAGTAAVNLRHLAALLDNAREGNAEPFLVFPSPSECLIAEEPTCQN